MRERVKHAIIVNRLFSLNLKAIAGKIYNEPTYLVTTAFIAIDLPLDQVVKVASWPDVHLIASHSLSTLIDASQGQIMAGNIVKQGNDTKPSRI